MRIVVSNLIITIPGRVTAREALDLHCRGLLDGRPFLLMAKDWRVDSEDDDYEELTHDELDDPDFLEDFSEVLLELW